MTVPCLGASTVGECTYYGSDQGYLNGTYESFDLMHMQKLRPPYKNKHTSPFQFVFFEA